MLFLWVIKSILPLFSSPFAEAPVLGIPPHIYLTFESLYKILYLCEEISVFVEFIAIFQQIFK